MMGMEDAEDEALRALTEWQRQEQEAADADARRRLNEIHRKEEWRSAWKALAGPINGTIGWYEDRIPLVINLAEVIQRHGRTECVASIAKRISLWFRKIDEPHAYQCPVLCVRPFGGDLKSSEFQGKLRGIESAAIVLLRAIQGKRDDLVPQGMLPKYLSSDSWECLGKEVCEGYDANHPIEPQLALTTDGRVVGLFLAMRDGHLGTVKEWPELRSLLQRRFGASHSPMSLFDRLKSWLLSEKDLDGFRADYLFLNQVIEWLSAAEIEENKQTSARAEMISNSLPQSFNVQEFIRLMRKCGQDFRDARIHRGTQAQELFHRILENADSLLSRAWESGWLRSIAGLKEVVESGDIAIAFLGSHLVGYRNVSRFDDPESSHYVWLLEPGLIAQPTIRVAINDDPPTNAEIWEQHSFEILGCYAHAMETIAENVTSEMQSTTRQESTEASGLYGNGNPSITPEDAREAVIAYLQRKESESTNESSSTAEDPKKPIEAIGATRPSVKQSTPYRRGRLTKEESDRLKTTMMAHLREHPTLQDNPELLASMIGVSESTIRRWLEEIKQKWREQMGAKSTLDDDE